MNLEKLNIKDLAALKAHIKGRQKTLYVGSCTSTVIPFDLLQNDSLVLVNLSSIEGSLDLNEQGELRVRGAVSWEEAQNYCLSQNRCLKSWPTEQSALILSGLATAATGERSFGHGSLRQQVRRLDYLDYQGEERTLEASRLLKDHVLFGDTETQSLLERYQASYGTYRQFKNAPFPRLEFETDLMIGFEGQLGVITQTVLETSPRVEQAFLVVKLPSWRESLDSHLEVFHSVQNLRLQITACEFIDAQALSELPADVWPYPGSDLIYFEMNENQMEEVFEKILATCPRLEAEDFFQVDEVKIRHLRLGVPRLVSELNAKERVTKLGTDIQMLPSNFEKLLKRYQQMAMMGVRCVLFGHFGDAHLHFNYLAKPAERNQCQEQLFKLYQEVKDWQGSPFAEHGIGLLKAPYIKPFYNDVQFEMFTYLKEKCDPYRQFFPQGFMSLERP